MTKFRPAFAARFSTLNVAIPVVAMPVTWASGLPALNVSTVSVRHEMPWVRKRLDECATISWAVMRAGSEPRIAYRIASTGTWSMSSAIRRRPSSPAPRKPHGQSRGAPCSRPLRGHRACMARLPTREARRQRQRPHPSIWPSPGHVRCAGQQQRRTDPQVRAPTVRSPPRICSRSRRWAARAARVVSRMVNTPFMPGPSHDRARASAATPRVRLAGVPVIAETEHDQTVLLDKGLLRQVVRVGGAIARFVVGVIENRLLRDDQVAPRLDGARQHPPRRHHRRRHARDHSLRVAR